MRCTGTSCQPTTRHAQAELPAEEFFARIGAIRKQLYTDPHFHDRVFAVIAAGGSRCRPR